MLTRSDQTDSGTSRFDPVLAAIVVVAGVIGAVLTSRAHEWAVMTDELLYTEMARSMAGTFLPLPSARGELVQVYQVLYPLVIAPVVGLFSMPDAYSIITGLNAVIMVSAAIPAYLLTNYITGDRAAARLAALATSVVPWISLGTKIFTDALAFPLFVLAVYAIVVAVAEPRRRHDLLALGALLLAYLARSQFVLLLPVFCAVLGACEGPLRAPRRHPLVFAVTLVAFVLLAVKPEWIVGIYTAATSGGFDSIVPPGTARAMVSHLGMIAVGLGTLPVVLGAGWIGGALFERGEPRRRAAALTILLASLVVLFVGASFDQRYSLTGQIYERYIFYIAPLLIVAAAALFVQPPRHWVFYAVPVLGAVLLIAADEHYGLDTRLTISLGQAFKPVAIFEIELQHVVDASGFLPSVTTMLLLIAAGGGAIAWWAVTSGRARVAMHALLGFTALWCFWALLYTTPKVSGEQNRAARPVFGERSDAEKRWIDRATGGEEVSLVRYSLNELRGGPVDDYSVERYWWWEHEMWNESISTYYEPRAVTGGGLPTMRPFYKLGLDRETGRVLLRDGRETPWLLMSASDPRFAPFAAESVEQDGFALRHTGARPHAQWITSGLTYHGFVDRADPATVRVYAPPQAQRSTRATVVVKVQLRKRQTRPETPFARTGPRRSAGPTSVIRRKVCVPAGGYVDTELVPRAQLTRLPEIVRPRVLRIVLERDARACVPRR